MREERRNYRGSMNVTDALATSPNTAFAKLIQQVGVPRAVDMAVRLGLRSYALGISARHRVIEPGDVSGADLLRTRLA